MAAKKGKEKKPVTMFYYCMLRKPCLAKDIADLSGLSEDKKEVWTDANICELILENSSLVLEDAAEDFVVEDDLEFLKEKGIVNIYAVTFEDTQKDASMKILKMLAENYDGVLCSDTEDFSPVILGAF